MSTGLKMGLLLKTHDHFRVGIQAPQKAEFIKYVNMVRRRFLVLNSNGRTRRQLALVGYFRRYRRLPAAGHSFLLALTSGGGSVAGGELEGFGGSIRYSRRRGDVGF